MGSSSQRKGATGERELSAVLREYGFEVERGGSLTAVPDLVGLPGVPVEVKRAEKLRENAAHSTFSGWDAEKYGCFPKNTRENVRAIAE